MNILAPNKNISLRTGIAILAFVGSAAFAGAATLIQIPDIVTSGAGQNVFASDPDKNFNGTTSTQLVYNNGTGGSYLIIKFAKTTLTNVGDTITLSWTVDVINGSTMGGQAFRVGIFDIGSATDSGFQSATGYRADFGSATNARGFYDLNKGGSGNLFAGAAYTQFEPTDYGYERRNFALTNPAFIPDGTVNFSGSFSVELLDGNKVQISSSISQGGATASITDDDGITTDFNAVAIWISAGADGGNTLTFSDLTVSFAGQQPPAK